MHGRMVVVRVVMFTANVGILAFFYVYLVVGYNETVACWANLLELTAPVLFAIAWNENEGATEAAQCGYVVMPPCK